MKIEFNIPELIQIKKNLIDEFRTASLGEPTSLAWAVHDISREGNGAGSGRVISVGGTNLIAADVSRGSGGITIRNRVEKKLPLLENFEILAAAVIEVLGNSDNIALNFAYPLRPERRDGRLDGIFIRPTKEHSFRGLIGKSVGYELERRIYDLTGKKIMIACANDTVCLVLAGLSNSLPAALAAGVIGTGFNFGFFIDENSVVNLESGNFSRFEPTDSGAAIDRASLNPGAQLFEKEVSGGYLHLHYNILRDKTGAAGVDASNAADVSAAASVGSGTARCVLKKSASLAAAELAAIYEYKGNSGLNAVIEGSLYWRGFCYRADVDYFLTRLGIPAGAVKIISVDESSITGAAELII